MVRTNLISIILLCLEYLHFGDHIDQFEKIIVALARQLGLRLLILLLHLVESVHLARDLAIELR